MRLKLLQRFEFIGTLSRTLQTGGVFCTGAVCMVSPRSNFVQQITLARAYRERQGRSLAPPAIVLSCSLHGSRCLLATAALPVLCFLVVILYLAFHAGYQP